MKLHRLPVLFLAALVLASCGDDDENQTRVRAVHLSPGTPALDVVVNGTVITSGMGYAGSTNYEVANSGDAEIIVRTTAAGQLLLDLTPTLAEDTDYTLIAANFAADIEGLFLVDDNSEPDVENIKMRLVHAAPSAGNLDVWVTSPGETLRAPTLSNVAFGAVSAYLQLPDADLQVRMAPTGTTNIIIDSGSIDLTRGEIVTVVARDASGGGAPFGALVLKDVVIDD
jgi:hypothetical protein